MPLLIGVQVLNGILLPAILVFILLLVNDDKLMGHLKNTQLANFLGWGTTLVVSSAVAVLLASQFLGLFGIHVLH